MNVDFDRENTWFLKNYIQILRFVEVEPLVSKSRREVTCTTGAVGQSVCFIETKCNVKIWRSLKTCVLSREKEICERCDL